ncbi:divergent polysaccharide deacetylase family protein [Jannaschia formosa]|uniref:divergent polysaccharide deacetylase family protein n=1 Tax=Jannaschia formosa TaxID=2259592 RepID=UPI001074A7EB|nr:divergent polysaccharide deacetylase family protein [Jannaschia formosa]TFL18208.1 hypothetical protein DR046_10675 [Jannaschia formosa]
MSAIVLAGASLIAPTARQGPQPLVGAPGARPEPPAMAEVERTAPARPEALPERAPPEAQAAEPATDEAVELAIPAGSQFNRPREDFQPVAPDAGEAARGFASAPVSRPAAEGPVAAPAPDTSSGAAPVPGTVVAGVLVPEAGEAPALPAPVEETAPRTFREVVPIGEAPEDASLDTRVPDAPEDEAARVVSETLPAETGSGPAAGSEAPVVLEGVGQAPASGGPSAGETPALPVERVEAAPRGFSEEAPAGGALDVQAVIDTGSAAPLAETGSEAPVVLEGVGQAPAGGGPSAGETPVLPVERAEAAPRSRSEEAPAGGAPDVLAAIDTGPAEPLAGPPAVAERVGATEAPLPADGADLAGAATGSDLPAGGTAPRLSAAPGTEAAIPAEEPPAGAPAVLERISVPAALSPGSRPEPAPAFRDGPVERGAEGAADAPVRVVPRRILLDSAREPSVAPAAEPAPAPGGGRALTEQAAAFENPDGKPLFSVVLIDDPEGGVSRSALLALDMPLTFAVDPARPDAAEVAQAYREAGHEVLMLAEGLPVAGAPGEIAAAVLDAQAALPQAVGVLDRRSDGFVRNGTALSALVPPMAEAGLGLVGYGGGLGDGLDRAEREGVPSEAVYRVVDEGGERATVLTRYLDRATFEAAETGQVIVVGRTRPAMVTALLSWSLGRRADTVALAPVSAVLLASESGF